jgi:hypothetical protein
MALVRTDKVFLRSLLRLLVIANVVLSSPILFTLMIEAIRSSEASVLTRAARRNISKDGILKKQCENWGVYQVISDA